MRWGLRATIVLALTAILCAVGLLISVVVLRVNERLLLEEAARGAQATASVIASTLEQPLADGIPRSRSTSPLQLALARLARLPDVEGLAVIGPDLQLLAQADRLELPAGSGNRLLDPQVAPTMIEGRRRGEVLTLAGGGRFFRSYVPLRGADGKPLAVLRATFALRSLDHQLAGGMTMVLLYLALDALLLVLFGSWLLDRLIVRPLRRIAQATERITTGTLDPIGVIESGNEIGRLSISFNQMVEALAQQRRSLQVKIAELSRANQELDQARSSMIRAERLASVGTLAAGVAHEVGNPLAAILGYAELLLQDDPQSEQTLGAAESREILVRIRDQTLRIHRIIRDLLDYSRSCTSPLTAPRGDVTRAVRLALALLEPQPRRRGLTLQVELPETLPAVALDEEQLVQVLVNLLLNSTDALAGSGTITLQAEVRRRPAGAEMLRLTVADDGPGIPPEIRQRVFDPFFTTKDPGEGTGLGLAICERILTDAGGEIELTVPPGGGTAVHLSLPLWTAPGAGTGGAAAGAGPEGSGTPGGGRAAGAQKVKSAPTE